MIGVNIDADSLQKIATGCLAYLPKNVLDRHVKDSLRFLLGNVLDSSLANLASHRLAGNIDKLSKLEAVPYWEFQTVTEVVIAQIIFIKPRKIVVYQKVGRNNSQKKQKPGVLVRFRILTGLPAGVVLTKTFSLPQLLRLKTAAGFSPYDKRKYKLSLSNEDRKKNLPLSDIREYSRLAFILLVSNAKTAKGALDLIDISCTPALKKHNLELIKMRHRVNFKCPKNWQIPCYNCPVGWDACPASCHKISFIKKGCPSCNQDSYFDPEEGQAVCSDCLAKTELPPI